MRRREFITLVGGAASTWPFAASAQAPLRRPLIGFLAAGSKPETEQYYSGFLQGMHEFGYVDDRAYAVEVRYADGDFEPAARAGARVAPSRTRCDCSRQYSRHPGREARNRQRPDCWHKHDQSGRLGPGRKRSAYRTRHFDAVPVVHPTVRPIDRLATPSAANSTIRARCRSRCSVLVERAKPSSSARSFAVRMITVASGMPLMHP